MASPQITKIKLADGRVVAFVDWTDKPLWSTLEILNGTTTQELDFFQYTVGDSVPAFAPVAVTGQRSATELDTNMAQPGAMSSTEEMLVFAIRPEVFKRHVAVAATPNFGAPVALTTDGEPFPTPAMLSVLALRTTLSLEISQKTYSAASFGYFNWGAGAIAAANPAAAVYGNQGLASQEAVRALVVPQHIGGQEKFRVFMTFADDGTGGGIELGLNDVGNETVLDETVFARIRVYLDGLYKRPVS